MVVGISEKQFTSPSPKPTTTKLPNLMPEKAQNFSQMSLTDQKTQKISRETKGKERK